MDCRVIAADKWVRFPSLPLKYKIMIVELIMIWLTLGILKLTVLILKEIK